MKKYLLAVSLVMAATPVFAACSEQQLTEKATLVATKLEALSAKNPTAAQEVTMKMMTAQSDPKAAMDMNAMCKSYDDLLIDMAKVK